MTIKAIKFAICEIGYPDVMQLLKDLHGFPTVINTGQQWVWSVIPSYPTCAFISANPGCEASVCFEFKIRLEPLFTTYLLKE